MRAVFAMSLCMLAGCAAIGPQEADETKQGPADLGQTLSIDIQNPTSRDLDLRFDLPGQPPFSFHMPAGESNGFSVTPNVAKAYEGSVPLGATLTVTEDGKPGLTFTVEDRGHPAFLLIQPRDEGSLDIVQFDDQPGYD